MCPQGARSGCNPQFWEGPQAKQNPHRPRTLPSRTKHKPRSPLPKFLQQGDLRLPPILRLQQRPRSREAPGPMLTMLCMALNGNIRGLAVALDAIREKKEGEAA